MGGQVSRETIDRRGFIAGTGAVLGAGAMFAAMPNAFADDTVDAAGGDDAGQGAASDGDSAAEAPYAAFDAQLKSLLRLDTHAIGLKFYESTDDVPAEAIWPVRDLGKHMAVCQAFSLARMREQTICMTLEDHWCWGPLVGYGLVDGDPGTEAFDVVCQYLGIEDPEATKEFFTNYPRLPKYKYNALVVAPLTTMTFTPDVVLIYGNPFQINFCCLCAKYVNGDVIHTEMDGIDSCVHEVVGVMTTDEYKVCFPDPGEIVRARALMTEATICIPGDKLDEFVRGVNGYGMTMGYNFEAQYEMPLDFERPPFYNEIYALWGLEQGRDW